MKLIQKCEICSEVFEIDHSMENYLSSTEVWIDGKVVSHLIDKHRAMLAQFREFTTFYKFATKFVKRVE